jgi:hypothetical protein
MLFDPPGLSAISIVPSKAATPVQLIETVALESRGLFDVGS